jgi:hypothetical protein
MHPRRHLSDPPPVLRRCASLLVAAGFAASLLLCCIHCSLGSLSGGAEPGECCAARAASHSTAPAAPCNDSLPEGCLWQMEYVKGDGATEAPPAHAPLVFLLGVADVSRPDVLMDAPLADGFPPPSALRPECSLGRFSRAHAPPCAA